MARTTEAKIEILKDVVRRLEQNLRGAIANDALLRRINNQSDIIPTFNNTVEGHGFGVIQHGLIELLILALTRCYDTVAANRASLPHVIKLLSDDAVVDRLALDARDWLPGGSLADLNERTVREKIHSAITEYDRTIVDEKFERALIALRHYRDDYLAHSLVQMSDRERLIFGNLEDVLGATLPIVAALTLAVYGLSWVPDDSRRAWDGYADAFWCRTLPR